MGLAFSQRQHGRLLAPCRVNLLQGLGFLCASPRFSYGSLQAAPMALAFYQRLHGRPIAPCRVNLLQEQLGGK